MNYDNNLLHAYGIMPCANEIELLHDTPEYRSVMKDACRQLLCESHDGPHEQIDVPFGDNVYVACTPVSEWYEQHDNWRRELRDRKRAERYAEGSLYIALLGWFVAAILAVLLVVKTPIAIRVLGF
jgi:hypothetical protein